MMSTGHLAGHARPRLGEDRRPARLALFGIPVVGTLSAWLPWQAYDDRPIFSFYAVMMRPFMVVAVALVCGRLIGRSRAPTPRRTAGVVVAGSFLVLVLLSFAWFWPIHTNQLLTHSEWLDRVWFERWI